MARVDGDAGDALGGYERSKGDGENCYSSHEFGPQVCSSPNPEQMSCCGAAKPVTIVFCVCLDRNATLLSQAPVLEAAPRPRRWNPMSAACRARPRRYR